MVEYLQHNNIIVIDVKEFSCKTLSLANQIRIVQEILVFQDKGVYCNRKLQIIFMKK